MENILILNHTGWLGGAELSLLRYLERTKIPREKILCVANRSGPLLGEIKRLGYRIHPLSIPVPGLQKSPWKKASSWVRLSWTILELAAIVKKHDIGILYANSHRSAFPLLVLRTIFPGLRLVTHVRDRIDGNLKRNMVVSKTDKIIAISDYVALNLGIDITGNGKLKKIPSGIDAGKLEDTAGREEVIRELGIPQGSFVFGMFCQVLPWKGVREYIEASLETIRNCEHAYSIMVGDDSFSGQTGYFREVKRKVKEGGMDGRIHFTGFKRDVERYLSCVDVVVSASLEEPLGQTLLQAMAMGKPVIATKSGGPLEIVSDSETGLLVEPGDITALGEAMNWFYQHQDEAKKMGERGKERFYRLFLTAGEMAEKIDEVLIETQTS